MFATAAEDDQSTVFSGEEASLVRKLAEPKPKNLTVAEYVVRYQGYDWLLKKGVIEDPRSKAAHKAWTTTRLWQSQVLAGDFSHYVTVRYEVSGQKFSFTDNAVCEAHGATVARRAVRKIAKDLGLSKINYEIGLAPIPEEERAALRAAARRLLQNMEG